jgi:transposase-like protein
MPRPLNRQVPSSFLVGRRRWRREDAREVLERLEASGLSVREFAAREGLDRQRVYRWRAQLGGGSPTRMPAFVEVKAIAAPSPIEVVLQSGHVIRVHDGFSAETLRQVVSALAEPGARC